METITMTKIELDRYEVIKKLIKKEAKIANTAKMLRLSPRQIKRLKKAVKERGAEGLIHGNRGKPSNCKLPDKKTEEIEKIVREKYYDFGPTFASEKLEENHEIKISKETLRKLLISWDLWKARSRKANGGHREWRERKECYGEMEQFDGSYHFWFEDRGGMCCLLAAIDDATGRIIKAKFGAGEGIRQIFDFWRDYTERIGKPASIYLDKYSTYKKNHKNILDEGENLTQFERAMEDLGINVIHAQSAQAKGRVERLFGTLQDRLIKELRLEGVSSAKEANKFLEEVFIPRFNQKFAVTPQKKDNLHRSLTEIDKNNLDKIFSIHSIRTADNDFTVRFKNKWYQLLREQPILVLRHDKILVQERMTGEVILSLRGRNLSFKALPERPKREKELITALSRKPREYHKPGPDHPWKRSFENYKRRQKEAIVK